MDKPKSQRARGPQQPGTPKKGDRSERTAGLTEYIGRELRAMFDDVVAEPVPERFRELLEELEKKQPKT
jgi:hypothetical protein